MPTHTYTINFARGSDTLSVQESYTADTEKGGDFIIPAGAVNYTVFLAFKIAGGLFRSIMMTSDQAVTIKTNSTSTPQETINLAANVPILKRYDDGLGALFAGDVTELFVTNGGPNSANLRIRELESSH